MIPRHLPNHLDSFDSTEFYYSILFPSAASMGRWSPEVSTWRFLGADARGCARYTFQRQHERFKIASECDSSERIMFQDAVDAWGVFFTWNDIQNGIAFMSRRKVRPIPPLPWTVHPKCLTDLLWKDLHLHEDLTDIFKMRIVGIPATRDIAILKRCKNLKHLDLSSTNIDDDALCAVVESLAGLETIYIGNSRVTAKGLAALERLPSLAIISARECSIGDVPLDALVGLPRLRALDLRRTGIGHKAIESLCNLRSLISLDVSCNHIDDEDVLKITGRLRLSAFVAFNTGITDLGVECFCTSSILECLGLGGTLITDAAIPMLKKCSRLQYLGLSHTAITSVGQLQLNQLNTLRRIWLRHSAVTLHGLLDLSTCNC